MPTEDDLLNGDEIVYPEEGISQISLPSSIIPQDTRGTGTYCCFTLYKMHQKWIQAFKIGPFI